MAKGSCRSCVVLHCNGLTKNMQSNKKYFNVPKADPLRSVFLTFSRRGDDFRIDTKRYSICEDHFHPSCFMLNKKNVLKLKKQAVPTIFREPTADGEEIIVVTFDFESLRYLEESTLLNPVYNSKQHEQSLLKKQMEKAKELGKLCRICFDDNDDKPLIPISKLNSYSITPAEVFTLLGLDSNVKIFSSSICEECFQHITSFVRFRKRCSKAQDNIVEELNYIDMELQKVRGSDSHNSWNDLVTSLRDDEIEANVDDDDEMFSADEDKAVAPDVKNLTIDLETGFQKVFVKVEREDDDESDSFESYHMETNDFDSDNETSLVDCKTEEIEEKIEEQDADLKARSRKKSAKLLELEAAKGKSSKKTNSKSSERAMSKITRPEEPKSTKWSSSKTKTNQVNQSKKRKTGNELDIASTKKRKIAETNEAEPDDGFQNEGELEPESTSMEEPQNIIQIGDSSIAVNSKLQTHASRIFECFFCRQKFGGRTTYKAHDCQVKFVKCLHEGCERKFTNTTGLNQHQTHMHKLPYMKKEFCATCKMYFFCNKDDHLSHVRKCETKDAKGKRSQAVSCKICGKEYASLRSLTIHMMYHTSTDNKFVQKGTPSNPRVKKEKAVMPKGKGKKEALANQCDQCGKTFSAAPHLKEHVRSVHRLDDDPMLTCDYCGKPKKTKKILAKHIRSVHLVKLQSCHVCGKICRNNALLQSHMIIHNSRINRCELCLDHAQFTNIAALKRHVISFHGPGFICDCCGLTLRSSNSLDNHRASVHGIQKQLKQQQIHEKYTMNDLHRPNRII